MRKPKLRDGKNRKRSELYPLTEIPQAVIYSIGQRLIYNFATGKKGVTGEDWGDIFAVSIGGEHLSSPLGLADVIYERQGWSVKSVKHTNPHNAQTIRVISGRNSPDYSYDISDPRADIQATGNAVLGIWNERLKIALDNFDFLRTCILVRNEDRFEFTLFEFQTHEYVPTEFEWSVNKRGNLEGFSKKEQKHKFTWQPHGSQFTIKHDIPVSAIKFRLKAPPKLDFSATLKQIGYQQDWITIE